VEATALRARVATDSLPDRDPDRLWASILAILLLFALGGAGLYALHAGVPLGAPRAADVPRSDAGASTVTAPSEVRPAAAERPGPSTDTGARVENSTLPSWPPTPPLATAVHSETYVVKAGSTATAISRETYGPSLLLGLSLIKESNPHLEDLNWVMVGQKLRLPALTRGTLMRRNRDGSDSLLLTALPTAAAAERLARVVRAAEYQVVITPQWISDGLTLHRVEIAALGGTTEADGAWETAVANRWIGYADDPTGR
jgi:LysM repeat protein